MDKILVHGGQKLTGTVKISGSKNSALPILAATLLTKEQCVIHHVPALSDIHYLLQILRHPAAQAARVRGLRDIHYMLQIRSHLGAQVERASGTVTVTAENIKTDAPYDIVRKMRASVCVLGPLLGREKEATVSLPGGWARGAAALCGGAGGVSGGEGAQRCRCRAVASSATGRSTCT